VNKEAHAHWGMLRKKKGKLHTQIPLINSLPSLLTSSFFRTGISLGAFLSSTCNGYFSHPRKTDSKITASGPKSQRFMKKSERKQFSNLVVTTFPIRTVLRSEWKICKRVHD